MKWLDGEAQVKGLHDGLLYGCSMYHSGLMTSQCRGQTMTKKKKKNITTFDSLETKL